MAPRRAASGSGRCSCTCRRVRASALDRRGLREEQRRLTREMEELLQRGRQLGRTAFTRVLWQAINYGVENGVLQIYTGTLPNQLPPPPVRERTPQPPPQLPPQPPPQLPPQSPPHLPPQLPPQGAAPEPPEPLNCRSGVPSTKQVEGTAAGCAGVTRVAFHRSPESDRSDAVVMGTGTAHRGTGSPASVGVLRRLVSFVLYPLKLLLWPLPRPRPSVRVMELPAASAAARPTAAATPGTSSTPTPPLPAEGHWQPGVSGGAAAAGELRAVPAEAAAVAAAAPQAQRVCTGAACCRCQADGGSDTGDNPVLGPSPPLSTEVADPCQEGYYTRQLQQGVEGEGEGAGRSADDRAVVEHQDQLKCHPDSVPGCSLHLDK